MRLDEFTTPELDVDPKKKAAEKAIKELQEEVDEPEEIVEDD